MPTPTLTADELLATLGKSGLPTVLVEGTSDVRIYRRIEEMLGWSRGDVLCCGCRNNLLQVFTRRNEVQHPALAFLADRDMWLFQNTPPEYNDIVWTSGYSIENDAYIGSDVERLLESDERRLFCKLLDEVCEWFAFEVEEFRQGRPAFVARGIGGMLNDQRDSLRIAFLRERNFVKPNPQVVSEIRRNYVLNLRGKTLFDLLAQVIQRSRGKDRFNHGQLLWICVSMPRNPDHLARIVEELVKNLDPQEVFAIA